MDQCECFGEHICDSCMESAPTQRMTKKEHAVILAMIEEELNLGESKYDLPKVGSTVIFSGAQNEKSLAK